MKNLFTLCLFFSFLLLSCKKPPLNNNNNTFTAPNPTPNFGDEDGVMAAIVSLSYQSTPLGDISVEADVAAASFFNTSTTFFNAGVVAVNTNDLEINENNSYASISATTTNIDLDFSTSNGNTWNVEGSSDVPSFNHTTTKVMPGDIKFSVEVDEHNTSNSFTLGIVSAPSTCDSILYLIATESKTISKIVSNNTTSVTFSAAEMNGLTGPGVAQVAAYNFESSMISGKKIYFINEKVITDALTFE